MAELIKFSEELAGGIITVGQYRLRLVAAIVNLTEDDLRQLAHLLVQEEQGH